MTTGSNSSIKIPKAGGSFNPREVDASEYEPQIVELPDEVDTGGGGGRSSGVPMCARDDDNDHESGSSPVGRGVGGGGSVRSGSDVSGSSGTEDSSASSSGDEDCDRTASNVKATAGDDDYMDLACRDLSDEERERLWWQKLIEMRERYLDQMTEKEREDFLKSLEV